MPDNEETAETTSAEESTETSTTEEEFDKDRALATIRKQRESEAAAKQRAKELEAELQTFKDRDLTEQQKAAKTAAEAESRATAAEKAALQLDVALDKAPEGMSIAQIRKLARRLTGGTREEFEADADELFADVAPTSVEDEDTPRRRPRERLRPGAVPAAEPEETDPDKLAAQVPRMY